MSFGGHMTLFDAVRANGSHTLLADRMREAIEKYSPSDSPRVLDHPGDMDTPDIGETPGQEPPPHGHPRVAPRAPHAAPRQGSGGRRDVSGL